MDPDTAPYTFPDPVLDTDLNTSNIHFQILVWIQLWIWVQILSRIQYEYSAV